MADDRKETRNSMIAAAIILLVAGIAVYFMPKIVLAIGQFSPFLGFLAGCAIIGAFFLVFWLRARYRK